MSRTYEVISQRRADAWAQQASNMLLIDQIAMSAASEAKQEYLNLKPNPMTQTVTDRLTAKQLMSEFLAEVTTGDMTKKDYQECYQLLKKAESINPNAEFTVSNSLDQYLVSSILGYRPAIKE